MDETGHQRIRITRRTVLESGTVTAAFLLGGFPPFALSAEGSDAEAVTPVSVELRVNSGADFDPASCVPAPAGSFVHRVARTPHYDGVIRGQKEPAVIAICGIGPVNFALADPSKPPWRAL